MHGEALTQFSVTSRSWSTHIGLSAWSRKLSIVASYARCCALRVAALGGS